LRDPLLNSCQSQGGGGDFRDLVQVGDFDALVGRLVLMYVSDLSG
jgi:hypothetical protein